MKKPKRLTFTLTAQEEDEHKALMKVQLDFRAEAVWEFWRRIAARYNLRGDSLICEGTRVTGLPMDSHLQWCWPFPLKCEKKPVYHEKPR